MVGQVVTLGTLHHGTWLGRFGTSRNAHGRCGPDAAGASAYIGTNWFATRPLRVYFSPRQHRLPGPHRHAADNRLPGLAHGVMAFDARVMNEVGRP